MPAKNKKATKTIKAKKRTKTARAGKNTKNMKSTKGSNVAKKRDANKVIKSYRKAIIESKSIPIAVVGVSALFPGSTEVGDIGRIYWQEPILLLMFLKRIFLLTISIILTPWSLTRLTVKKALFSPLWSLIQWISASPQQILPLPTHPSFLALWWLNRSLTMQPRDSSKIWIVIV